MVSCSYGEAQATRVTVIPDRQSRDVTGSGFVLPLWMRLGEVSVAFHGCGHLEQNNCFEDCWGLLDTQRLQGLSSGGGGLQDARGPGSGKQLEHLWWPPILTICPHVLQSPYLWRKGSTG